MSFNIIAAYTKNRGIGIKNKLPWNIKSDLNFFKKTTNKSTIIMGRNTWNSLPKYLNNRNNVIITKNPEKLKIFNKYEKNPIIVKSLDEALLIKDNKQKFVIGGEQLYNEAILHNNCKYLYLNEINTHYDCDTYFPEIPNYFKLIDTQQFNEFNSKKYKNIMDINSEENQYIDCLKYILKYGEKKVDRTGVGTLSVFDINLKYNIKQIENNYQIPMITTKQMFYKSSIWELIWMLRGETNSKWLEQKNVNIWKGNSSKEFLTKLGLNYEEGELGPIYGKQWVDWNGINQIENIIDIFKTDKSSRRAVLSGWNVSDLNKMALPPCHLMYLFNITNNKLNCKTILRSNDMFLGNPFNTLNSSILTIILAKAIGIEPGQISMSISDAHIYLNHIEQIYKQIDRQPYEFPLLEFNKNINNYNDIYNLNINDFKFYDYYHHSKLTGKMAI